MDRSGFLVALVFCLCGGCGSDGSSFAGGDATAYVVGTDFVNSGVASRMSVPQLFVEQNTLAGVASTDPVIREFAGRVFIINRFGADNLTVIDAVNNVLIEQRSTGAGSNPQDIAVVGDTAYVATLGGTGLLVFDLAAMGAPPLEIDLSSLDPEDGIPNCHTISVLSNRAFVACQFRDDGSEFLSARGPGKIAVIDLVTNTLESVVELTGSPTGRMIRLTNSGDLLVPLVDPTFADLTVGCLERVTTSGTAASQGCALQNTTLGGYVSSFEETPDGEIFATVVSGFDPDDFGAVGSLYSLGTEASSPRTLSQDGARLFSLGLCPTGHIVVADAGGGLRLYDRDGSEVSSALVDIGAPVVQDGIVCF